MIASVMPKGVEHRVDPVFVMQLISFGVLCLAIWFNIVWWIRAAKRLKLVLALLQRERDREKFLDEGGV